MYCDVLNRRLSHWAESNNLLSEEQNGFRKGRSCIEHIYTLTTLVKHRLKSKKGLFACFIDARKAFDRVDRSLLWLRLLQLGLNGHLYHAIKSLYRNVTSAVRVNGFLTDCFPVDIGVKQGCLLSPLLFALFVDDLANEIKSLGLGVRFAVGRLSVLLYADDIVLLAESEHDLQLLLDTVNVWCRRWRVELNRNKTQVVHFRTKASPPSEVVFTCGALDLNLTPSYKYLGLVLHEHLDMSVTAKAIAQSASRALGLVISKCKANGGVPYKIYTKLYDALVRPVLEYGAGIYGCQEYSAINAVHNRACRFFMGVGRYTPSLAVRGDMGWTLPGHRQWVCVIRLWCHLCSISNLRLPRRVFLWSELQPARYKSWCTVVKKQLSDLGLNNLCNTALAHSQKHILHNVDELLKASYERTWYDKVSSDRGSTPGARNKLRTYKNFKKSIAPEHYLQLPLNSRDRRALAQLRCGVAPLQIELGRHRNIPLEDRICEFCDLNKIEDELHFIIECPLYCDLRSVLFKHACDIVANFSTLCPNDQLCILLSHEPLVKYSAKILRTFLDIRNSYVYV